MEWNGGEKTTKNSMKSFLENDSVIAFEHVDIDFLEKLNKSGIELGEQPLEDHEDEDKGLVRIVQKKNNIGSLTTAFMAAGTTGGTTYAFGLYASALKEELQLQENELDTISAAFFCAGLLSWIPGMAVDRWGPKKALTWGGILAAFFLLFYWSVATSTKTHYVVFILSFLGVATYMTCALITGSVFKLLVGNPHKKKGTEVGIAKGYVGLGSGAYTCLFESLKANHPGWSDLNFLPMAAFFTFAVVTIPALSLLDANPPSHKTPMKKVTTPLHFKIVFMGLFSLGAVVVGTSLSELFTSQEEYQQQSSWKHYFVAFFVVAVWFGPILSLLCLPVATDTENQHNSINYAPIQTNKVEEENVKLITANTSNFTDPESSITETKQGLENAKYNVVSNTDMTFKKEQDHQNVEDSATDCIPTHNDSSPFVDLNLLEMLQTLPAWLLLWTCTILAGGGTIMTNHIGQMTESLDFPAITAPACLALFSAAQAASRVVTGAISEWNRPAFLIIASLLCFVAHISMAFATVELWFVIAVIVSGAAFGMIWPLMVLTVGECFGTSHVGANYMFYDGVTPAIGTLLLSKFVAQTVYENNLPPSNRVCYGQECFQKTHYIVAGLSLTCVFTSILFLYKTRRIYTR